ncbi:MAG: CDP-alcohol phosphatidyltransferase family protein [Bacilli bacterium]|nr:CDP-alcohol phosphatidyltransferase family protein [Bacilli bacterium]
MLDGFVARKSKNTSKIGARLDSINVSLILTYGTKMY